MSALIAFEGLGKDWFGVPAVSGLTLAVEAGTTLGLIGENGAGKSTLMNMVGGVVEPSHGRMLWRGEPYAPRSAAEATARGIAFIHQELNLFTNLSIAENVFIDGFPKRYGLIDRRAMAERTAALLKRLNLDHGPDTLGRRTRPRRTPARRDRQGAAPRGRPHHLRRADHLADAARDGAALRGDRPAQGRGPHDHLHHPYPRRRGWRSATTSRCCATAGWSPKARLDSFDIPRMIRSMIGRDLAGMYPPRSAAPTERVVFAAEGLSQPGVIENVSFEIRAGEILGLFGLMGSGRSELARMIFGLDPLARGAMTLGGAALAGGPGARIAAGLAFVTENRRDEGLMLEAPVADNLSLVAVREFGRPPFALLDRGAHALATERARAELGVRAGDIAAQPVKALSGGNQQKVVIGKWLMSRPQLFILDEPTRGVDVGAKFEIYALADRLAASGNAVLFISSELEELIGMCDRVLVMSRGEITGAFAERPFDREAILARAFREAVA